MNLSDQEILKRYRTNYNIRPHAALNMDMVNRHWVLEKELRNKLLGSSPENRREVFEECYTKLYSELGWLNQETNQDLSVDLEIFYEPWVQLVGPTPQRVYEIGSGKAELLKLLARHGHFCKATEITQERGKIFAPDEERLVWGASDGIHLDRFEAAGSYDIVISNQVIEHMHPDDVAAHFQAVCGILKAGGRYIFATPQRLLGPADVSLVFDHPQPQGMHLKEYTHIDFCAMLPSAGFSALAAVIRLPKKVRQIAPAMTRAVPSSLYLVYLRGLEHMMASWPARMRRSVAKGLLFPKNVMMVAQKNL